MDKFEKLIKDAVEGHEMPFDPKAWDNVSKELGDSFEQLVKDSTSSYEAPYNSAAWDAVNHQLGPAYAAWKWIGGSAAVVAIIAGGSYLIDHSNTDNDQLTNHVSNEVVVHTENDNNTDNTFIANSDKNNEVVDNNVADNETDNTNDNIIHPIDPEFDHNVNVVEHDNELSVEHHENTGNSNENGNTAVETNEVNNNDNGTVLIEGDNNEVYDFKVSANFEMNAYEVCQGELCIFTPEVVHKDLIYVWSFGDGSFSSSIVGKHKFNKAGEYNVSLEIKDSRTNRTLGSKSESITINALPKVNFSWEQSSEIIPAVSFINLTDEAVQWNWNIKGLRQSNKNEFEYTFRKAGNYVVELTAKNDDGCTATTQKTISIEKDYNLLAPTAFSPDGDFQNDDFIPEALKIMDVAFTMTIYEKSGKMVYRTQNAYEPWDGRFTEDNIMAPSGSAYVWKVVLTNKDGEQEMYEGQVFVIR